MNIHEYTKYEYTLQRYDNAVSVLMQYTNGTVFATVRQLGQCLLRILAQFWSLDSILHYTSYTL